MAKMRIPLASPPPHIPYPYIFFGCMLWNVLIELVCPFSNVFCFCLYIHVYMYCKCLFFHVMQVNRYIIWVCSMCFYECMVAELFSTFHSSCDDWQVVSVGSNSIYDTCDEQDPLLQLLVISRSHCVYLFGQRCEWLATDASIWLLELHTPKELRWVEECLILTPDVW